MTRQFHQVARDGPHLSPFADAHIIDRGPGPGRVDGVEDAFAAADHAGQPTGKTWAGLATAAGLRAVRAPLQDGDPGRVGRYRLTARLGSGGMGVVYLGVDRDGRLVAVKILRPELARDPESRARFGREVAVLARVRGPRIVRVIEAGADSPRPFLVTDRRAAAGGRARPPGGRSGQRTIAGVTTPLAELSVDGGATFKPVPFGAPGPDPAITALTADAGGFTAAVQAGPPSQQDITIWTSADGASWAQSHVSGLSGTGTRQLTALASSGATVTGIGSTATPQTQRPVILTLPAHQRAGGTARRPGHE